MARLRYGGREFVLTADESVLDCLLRHGVSVPHACRAGSCRQCVMQLVDGAAPAEAQRGLKETQRAQGYFLPCSFRPGGEQVLTAASGGESEVWDATLTRVERLGARVLRVRLETDRPLGYRAGQFVRLVRADGLARTYSLASLPDEDPFLELHVGLVAGGQMSSWLAEARPGERVQLGPAGGEVFYLPGRAAQPMLLAGSGTGLAPLYGVLRDALRQGHTGTIVLVQGARRADGLYLQEELAALAARHPQLRWFPCVLEGPAPASVALGAVEEIVAARAAELGGWRVFLCGAPELVARLRKSAFLRGAGRRDIHADAFVPAPPTAQPQAAAI